MKTPASVAEILALVTADPGRPRLTWYGEGGERIELSGAVLANWVSKTTNLLVEEFDAGPGVRIGLDLPAHWRTVVWAMAVWRCGATVVLGTAAGSADVVVTDQPARHDGVDQLVAVALPGLARRFDGELPAGAVDAAGAVMTYGDAIGWAPQIDAGAPALDLGATVTSHAALVDWAANHTGARILVLGGPDRAADVATVLQTALGALVGGGSVVLLDSLTAAELAADPVRRDRLLRSERVTSTM